MSDFENKENTDLPEEAESTIFSAPADHKTVNKKSSKKILPRVISAVLILAILVGGTFAVIKFIPEKEDDTEDTSEFKEISVLNLKTDDIKGVTVKNSKGTFKFSSSEKKAESSEGDDSESTVLWYIDGVKKELQNSSKAEEIVSGLATVNATREITKKSEELCGLKSSEFFAEITEKSGKTHKLIFGGDSPDGSGIYFKLAETGKIYLTETSLRDNLVFNEFDFSAADSLPKMDEFPAAKDYFSDGVLSKFDCIEISGNTSLNGLKIIPNDDKTFSEFIGYKVLSPEEHFADNIDGLMGYFSSGISAASVYSYDVSKAEIKKFGLDNPDITMSMQVKSRKLIYKFKLTKDNDYAAWCNEGKYIYRVEESALSEIISGKPADYYSSLICLYPIDKLKNLTVKNGNKTYSFDIKANDDEETNDDIKYIISYKNKDIDCQSFQNLYQYMVSLSCHEYTVDNNAGKTAVSIIFGFKSGGNITVDFAPFGDTKYQYSTNGKPMGKIAATKISKFIKNLERLAEGKKIGELGS